MFKKIVILSTLASSVLTQACFAQSGGGPGNSSAEIAASSSYVCYVQIKNRKNEVLDSEDFYSWENKDINGKLYTKKIAVTATLIQKNHEFKLSATHQNYGTITINQSGTFKTEERLGKETIVVECTDKNHDFKTRCLNEALNKVSEKIHNSETYGYRYEIDEDKVSFNSNDNSWAIHFNSNAPTTKYNSISTWAYVRVRDNKCEIRSIIQLEN